MRKTANKDHNVSKVKDHGNSKELKNQAIDPIKIYLVSYSYESEVDGDTFHVPRNFWCVSGRNVEEATAAFWAAKKEIEKEIRKDAAGRLRTVVSLDALVEIRIPSHNIIVEKQ
jgi:hypothetical protein